jgi:hypothetical protein
LGNVGMASLAGAVLLAARASPLASGSRDDEQAVRAPMVRAAIIRVWDTVTVRSTAST